MGRNCISTYLNCIHSALRKNLRSLWKKTGLSIRNHYLSNRFISCWCSFLNGSAHNLPRHTRLGRWWLNGPYICNCWRYNSVITNKFLYCLSLNFDKLHPFSINLSIFFRFLLTYSSCFFIPSLILL